MQKHFDNWEIIKHLDTVVPWPYPSDGAITFIQNELLPAIEAGNSHVWVLTLEGGDGQAIGMVHVRHKDTVRQGNRGFWIAEGHQGQGLMTEAVHAVNDFIFNVLELKKITVFNASSNKASRRVKEKTGAIFVGTQKDAHHSGDTETEIWEMTKESWIAAKKALGG